MSRHPSILRRLARLTTLFLAVCPVAPVNAEIIGDPVPRAVSEDQMKASLSRIKLVDEKEQKFDLAAVLRNGKPTIVTLWAHWCPNCQAEAKGFKALAATCADRWNVVFVSSRQSDYAKDFAKFQTLGLPWRIYNVSRAMLAGKDNYATYRAFSGATTNGDVLTPLHYFINAQGRVDKIVNARMDFSAPAGLRAICGN